MGLSTEAIIGLVGIALAWPAAALALWKIARRTRFYRQLSTV